MVKSTCFQHTSSHPDKYNNSVDRIISKEEEREDPRRELQSIFEYSGVSTNNTRTTRFLRIQCILQELQCFHMQSSKLILHTELILPQETSKKYYNYKAHPVQTNTRHLPATVPVSPSILSSSQHPHSPLQLPRQFVPGQYRVTTVSQGILPRPLVPGIQDRTVS